MATLTKSCVSQILSIYLCFKVVIFHLFTVMLGYLGLEALDLRKVTRLLE